MASNISFIRKFGFHLLCRTSPMENVLASNASKARNFTMSNVMSCQSYATNQKPRRPFTVSVEGNIASGKTFFMDYFKNTNGVQVFPEPVHRWRNISGHNALALLYQDPQRWSLTLQTYIQLTMLQTHLAFKDQSVKIMERSLHSARYIFVENQRRCGMMSEVDYLILDEWFNWIVANHDCNVDLVVYLKTDPEVVLERIQTRGRKEEQSIPLTYLQTLHELYEDWLIRRKNPKWVAPEKSRILILDANQDAETMTSIYREQFGTFMNLSSTPA